jgi:hypothetical protein
MSHPAGLQKILLKLLTPGLPMPWLNCAIGANVIRP